MAENGDPKHVIPWGWTAGHIDSVSGPREPALRWRSRLSLRSYGSTWHFDPLSDIAAYELAMCQTVLIHALQDKYSAEALFAELPPEARRHFEEER